MRSLSSNASCRWRALAAISFGANQINSVALPDVDIIQKEKTETIVDLSLGYCGKSPGSPIGGILRV